MRRIGLVGFLLGALLLGGVGVVAYQMGVTAGASSAAVASGATVVYAAPWGFGFGFPFLGILFGLLFLGLLVGFARRVAFGGRGGPGGWGGRGPWMTQGAWGTDGSAGWGPGTDRPVPPPVAEMLGRWHEGAHAAAAGGGTAPAAGTAQPAAGAPTDPA